MLPRWFKERGWGGIHRLDGDEKGREKDAAEVIRRMRSLRGGGGGSGGSVMADERLDGSRDKLRRDRATAGIDPPRAESRVLLPSCPSVCLFTRACRRNRSIGPRPSDERSLIARSHRPRKFLYTSSRYVRLVDRDALSQCRRAA